MKIKIKVKNLGGMPIIVRNNGEWIDLCTCNTTSIYGPIVVKDTQNGLNRVTFDCALIGLGVAIQLPKGFEAWVVPRSSTPSRWGIHLRNSIGIIDNSYNGDNDEWKFPAICTNKTTIPQGTRIAQFRVMLSQKATVFQKLKWLFSNGIEIVYVDKLNNENRGGIGSTGV